MLVSRKLSPGGSGAGGPPSRTSSGFLCMVSTGGDGKNREEESRHSHGCRHHHTDRGFWRTRTHKTRDTLGLEVPPPTCPLVVPPIPGQPPAMGPTVP